MKTAKDWRQRARLPGKDITLSELYEYLETIFFNRTPPKEARIECTTFVNENGIEMIQVLSPYGILQTTAENWQKHMEEVATPFIKLDSSYYKSTPITSTKVTLDHGIEVTITYDGNDSQTEK